MLTVKCPNILRGRYKDDVWIESPECNKVLLQANFIPKGQILTPRCPGCRVFWKIENTGKEITMDIVDKTDMNFKNILKTRQKVYKIKTF